MLGPFTAIGGREGDCESGVNLASHRENCDHCASSTSG